MNNCWVYNGKCLESPPDGYYGYVCLITIIKHKDIPKKLWGKKYVGKKAFLHATKKRVTKKVIKETKTRKRVIKTTKDSGWLRYFGSSKELLEDIKKYGEHCFKREIICFTKNKSENSYYELVHQIDQDVMFTNSYNKWISAKVYKHLLNK